jgi:hypothetical protein
VCTVSTPAYRLSWDSTVGGWQVGTDIPACDFCATPLRDRWTRFDARPFTRSSVTDTGCDVICLYRGWWAACPRCAPLVHDRQWRRLVSRIIRVRRAAGDQRTVDRPDSRSELTALLLTFEQHLTGASSPGIGRWPT